MRSSIAKAIALSAVILMLLTYVPSCSGGSFAGGLPESYDADIERGYGELFPVREQGLNNTCWAFASSEAIESVMNILYGSETRISPLAMAYTHYDSSEEDDSYRYHDVYCCIGESDPLMTGIVSNVLLYGLTSGNISIVPEYCSSYDLSAQPYDYSDAKDIICSGNILIKGVECYNTQRDAELIKERVSEGYVGYLTYRHYNMDNVDGTNNDYTPYFDGEYVDHAVALVGWDDAYSRENFMETPLSDGAWHIRNSWGTGEHYDGYVWLSYETVIGEVFFFTDVGYESSDGTSVNVYQYDLGNGTSNDIICRDKASMANIFTADGSEVLEGVSFSAFNTSYDTVGENYKITVYRLNDGYSSPVDGEIVSSASGTVGCQGIIYTDLEHVHLSEGEVFSVVIELDNESGSIVIPIDTEESLPYYSHIYTAANPGESFINTDGEWVDVSTDRMTNVRIKAFTTSTVPGTVSSIDGTAFYRSIEDAISHGINDIRLLSDVEITSAISSDDDLLIDLNSFMLSSTVPGYAIDMPGHDVTVRNGYISSYDCINADAVTLDNMQIDSSGTAVSCHELYAHLTVISEGSVEVNGGSELFCHLAGEASFSGSDVTILGGIYSDVSFDDCDTIIQNGDFDHLSTMCGSMLISDGIFNNATDFSDDTSLILEGGEGFKADERDYIEDRMPVSCFEEGLRAIGSSDTGWSISPCCAYISDEPYDSLGDVLTMSEVSAVLSDDTCASYLRVTGDVSLDLNGHTLDIDDVDIDSGASLALFNGTVSLDAGGLHVLSDAVLTIGSGGTETVFDCGTSMIDLIEGSYLVTEGEHQITWCMKTEMSRYSFDVVSFTSAGGRSVIISEGQCYDNLTGEATACTAARTIWSEGGLYHDSVCTLDTDRLNASYVKDDTSYSYSAVYDNGQFVLDCEGQIEKSKYTVESSVYDGLVVITASITGLRYSPYLPDETVDKICDCYDEMKDHYSDSIFVFMLTCNISTYNWHDVSEPYKMFSAHAVGELKERGCTLAIQANGALLMDLSDADKGECLYASVEYVQNSFMTDAQKRIVGLNDAFFIECSSESLLAEGIQLYIVQESDDMILYHIDTDGSFESIDSEAGGGMCSTVIYDAGMYAFSEAKEMVIGEHPKGRELTYNGSEQELIVPASAITGGKAEYSLDRETWLDDVPKAKDSGTYTVYYRYVATELGYSDSETASLTVTVAEMPNTSFSDAVIVITIVSASIMALLVLIRVLWIRKV